jgi:hypothetical protein
MSWVSHGGRVRVSLGLYPRSGVVGNHWRRSGRRSAGTCRTGGGAVCRWTPASCVLRVPAVMADSHESRQLRWQSQSQLTGRWRSRRCEEGANWRTARVVKASRRQGVKSSNKLQSREGSGVKHNGDGPQKPVLYANGKGGTENTGHADKL